MNLVDELRGVVGIRPNPEIPPAHPEHARIDEALAAVAEQLGDLDQRRDEAAGALEGVLRQRSAAWTARDLRGADVSSELAALDERETRLSHELAGADRQRDQLLEHRSQLLRRSHEARLAEADHALDELAPEGARLARAVIEAQRAALEAFRTFRTWERTASEAERGRFNAARALKIQPPNRPLAQWPLGAASLSEGVLRGSKSADLDRAIERLDGLLEAARDD